MATSTLKTSFAEKAAAYKRRTDAVLWTELDQNMIYKVISLAEKNSKWDAKCWLTIIEVEKGERLNIFAPRAMVEKIRRDRKKGESPYFMPLGNVVKDAKTHNVFDLCFELDEEALDDLFVKDDTTTESVQDMESEK